MVFAEQASLRSGGSPAEPGCASRRVYLASMAGVVAACESKLHQGGIQVSPCDSWADPSQEGSLLARPRKDGAKMRV